MIVSGRLFVFQFKERVAETGIGEEMGRQIGDMTVATQLRAANVASGLPR